MEERSVTGIFIKYDKMGEDSGSVGAAAGSGRYIVTEKIHGANFCIIAKLSEGCNIDVCFAKRTAVIGSESDAEDFYNCRSSGLLRKLSPLASALFNHVAGAGGHAAGAVAIHIYGELFGGRYPHPDVPPVDGLEPVQNGIWYAPDLRFMAFDVAIDLAGQRSYLSFPIARQACEACGFLFAEPLCEGTLSECLDFKIEFETTVPLRLGLPPIPLDSAGESKNLAEGVVIRPCVEPTFRHSSSRKESGRGLFKRKIEAFCEKRYQNDNWRKGKAGGTGCASAETDGEAIKYEILAHVTEQRLANVLSKIGRPDLRNKEACCRLLEDFKEDVREALCASELAVLHDSSSIQEELDQECRATIQRELLGKSRTSGQGVGAEFSSNISGA